jgi:hypothetical protein
MDRVDRLIALLLACVVGGCSLTYTEVGRDVPVTDGLEVGVTTEEEVLARLGPPRVISRQFDGVLYTWRHLKGRRRSLTLLPIFVQIFHWEVGQLLRDDVSLLLGNDGILRAIGIRLETREPGEE